jgi:hypothetical protein
VQRRSRDLLKGGNDGRVEGWEKRRQNTEARSQETGFTRLWLGQKREGIKMRSRKREIEKTGKKGKTKKREDGITKTPFNLNQAGWAWQRM